MEKTLEEVALPPYDVKLLQQTLALEQVLDPTSTDVVNSRKILAHNFPLLTPDQNQIFDYMNGGLVVGVQRLDFLDWPGGTGKTFLLNSIIQLFYAHNVSTAAVSSSGVAALLLHLGTTAHSGFKIPFLLDATSTCNLSG